MEPTDDLLNDDLSDDIQNTPFEIGDPDGSGFNSKCMFYSTLEFIYNLSKKVKLNLMC